MNVEIIVKITESDRVFGKLCLEAQNSYEQENYFSALACLFVLTEQIIKFSVDKIDGNFHRAIKEAKEKNLINDTEFQFLNSLKEIRNKIFHESHYPTGLEIGGEGIFALLRLELERFRFPLIKRKPKRTSLFWILFKKS